MRSAHSPPHHARSSGVAKHHVDAPGATSSKPAACAQARRNRPASGSPALRRAMVRYSASQRSDRRLVGIPAEDAVVGVARRDEPARLAHALHLAQRGHGVGEMLEHLMRVHDVERVVVDVRARRGRRPRTRRSDRRRRSRRACSITSADASMPRTRPGATRRPMSAVIVPGPHPSVEHAAAAGEVAARGRRPSSRRFATCATAGRSRGGRACRSWRWGLADDGK